MRQLPYLILQLIHHILIRVISQGRCRRRRLIQLLLFIYLLRVQLLQLLELPVVFELVALLLVVELVVEVSHLVLESAVGARDLLELILSLLHLLLKFAQERFPLFFVQSQLI